LNFVKKDVPHGVFIRIGGKPFFYIREQVFGVKKLPIIHIFKIEVDNAPFFNTLRDKRVAVHFEQGRFSAPADAGDDFDNAFVPVASQFFYIRGSLDHGFPPYPV
jgi:hypothetical protein